MPEDDWLVDIIDGPRDADGQQWWDISRVNIDGGGTGWVYISQAGYNVCADPPTSENLVLIQELSVSSMNPSVNQDVTGSYRVKNNGTQAITLDYLGIQGRLNGDLNGTASDFFWIENLTLQPGEEYSYASSRSFDTAGVWRLRPNYKPQGGDWSDVHWADGTINEVWITVEDAPAPFTSCVDITGIPTTECNALVALYNSTNGPNWTKNDGWLATDRPCSWYGVYCSSGHVAVIFLVENQLTGNIPSEIGQLTYLEDIDLSKNQLSGDVPTEFGNLTNLREIEMYSNQLSGNSNRWLDKLVNLQYIDVGSNDQLSGEIPQNIEEFTQLVHLDLEDNQFTGSLPSALGNLSNLRYIEIENNQFSGSLPANLSKLTSLEVLNINNNPFSGPIPTSFTSLSNLVFFSFYDTDLCEPTNADFQAWLAGIPTVESTGVRCDGSPPPPPPGKPLVILVHGCCGGDGYSFGLLPNLLANDGYPVYVIDQPNGKTKYWPPDTSMEPDQELDPIEGYNDKMLPENAPIWVSGDNLIKLIDDAKMRAHKATTDKVILIAHSKGGLISRAYLESSRFLRRKDVSKVIMLGTPNQGSPWAELGLIRVTTKPSKVCEQLRDEKSNKYELCELTPTAANEFNQTYSTRAANVDYYLVAGHISPGSPNIWGADDLIVGTDSVHGISGSNVKNRTRFGAVHFGGSTNGYMTLNNYTDCIRPLVKGETSQCTGYVDLDNLVKTSDTDTNYTQADIWSGRVGPSQTISHELQVDVSGASSFQLLWSESELDLTLSDSNGNSITPTVAGIDSNILFSSYPVTDAMYAVHQYLITATTPGRWVANVTGDVANTQDVDFVVVVNVESELHLELSTDKDYYAPDENAIILANLVNGTAGFDGATLTATIQQPDGVTHMLLLSPRGGVGGEGIYEATYNQTGTSGYYHVTVESTGTLNGSPFVRSTQGQFVVSSNNASLTGSYSDTPQDEDGDGYHETLQIAVGVDVAVAGNYSIAALLKDSKGEVIANQVLNTNLARGITSIPIVFDGQIIRDHGMDGPYIVAEVRAVDNSSISLLADEAFNAHTTAAYKYTQFGNPSAGVYLPIILK